MCRSPPASCCMKSCASVKRKPPRRRKKFPENKYPSKPMPAKLLRAMLCALCALGGSLIPAQALDRSAFTITNYDLNLRIELAQQRLAVRGKITLRNDSPAPQKNLSLQISSSLDW